MSEKLIPEELEENFEDDQEIPSFCDIFIPREGENDEDNNEKK